jgi:hypothetical protein
MGTLVLWTACSNRTAYLLIGGCVVLRTAKYEPRLSLDSRVVGFVGLLDVGHHSLNLRIAG